VLALLLSQTLLSLWSLKHAKLASLLWHFCVAAQDSLSISNHCNLSGYEATFTICFNGWEGEEIPEQDSREILFTSNTYYKPGIALIWKHSEPHLNECWIPIQLTLCSYHVNVWLVCGWITGGDTSCRQT
jgi:hypothetical protein